MKMTKSELMDFMVWYAGDETNSQERRSELEQIVDIYLNAGKEVLTPQQLSPLEETVLRPTFALRWSKSSGWDGSIGHGVYARRLEQCFIDDKGKHRWIEVPVES